MIQFPPWKKADDLFDFPAFDLPVDRVTIKVTEWNCVIDAFDELIEA